MKKFVKCVSSFEGRVYSDQQTGVIEDKPAVKIQSASAAPGIAPTPRSVVQVPMTDDESAGSGGVPGPGPMLSGDEEGEDDESGHDDDEEEVDEINHEKLPKVTVLAHSPGKSLQEIYVIFCRDCFRGPPPWAVFHG